MLDTLGKEDLKKLAAELANPIDSSARLHAASIVLGTLLSEEIGKRPDKAEPAEEHAEEVAEKKGARR